jgi:hypothetical protein
MTKPLNSKMSKEEFEARRMAGLRAYYERLRTPEFLAASAEKTAAREARKRQRKREKYAEERRLEGKAPRPRNVAEQTEPRPKNNRQAPPQQKRPRGVVMVDPEQHAHITPEQRVEMRKRWRQMNGRMA